MPAHVAPSGASAEQSKIVARLEAILAEGRAASEEEGEEEEDGGAGGEAGDSAEGEADEQLLVNLKSEEDMDRPEVAAQLKALVTQLMRRRKRKERALAALVRQQERERESKGEDKSEEDKSDEEERGEGEGGGGED